MKKLFLLIYFLKISIPSPLIFPFSKKNQYDKKTNFFLYYRENDFYTNLTLGNPKTIIPSKLTFFYSPCAIKSSNLKGIYDEKKSKTYNKTNEYQWTFSMELFLNGFLSKENIILKNYDNKEILYDNYSFILVTKLIENITFPNSITGLKYEDTYLVREQGLIYQLKQNKLIENHAFTILFNEKNDKEGNLIIGNYPHEYDSGYNDSYFKTSKLKIFYTENVFWVIKMDSIIWGNEDLSGYKNMRFVLDINAIICPSSHLKSFENFFKQFQGCKKNSYKNGILNEFQVYFTCDLNFDINNFPPVKFISKDFNFTFELNAIELFIKDEDKFLFLIVINENYDFYWDLGTPFLKKYQMVFDIEKKLVGFYSYIDEKSKGKKKGSEGKKKPFSFYLSFIFGIIIIVLGFIMYKILIALPRKRRANELIDDYEYFNNEIN